MAGKRRQQAVEKWKVLISTTLIQSIVCGILESYGALFVPMMRGLFAKDSLKTVKAALIGSLGSGLLMGFSPISSVLSRKLGILFTSILGGIIVFLATFAASFSTTFLAMALTYGVLLGIGCSLLFITNNIIISQHFGEDSVVAFGLLGFGNGVMNSVMPHIISFAVDSIGLSGAIRTICFILIPIIFLPFYWKEIDPEDEKNMSIIRKKKYSRMPGTLVKETFFDNDEDLRNHDFNQANSLFKKSLKKRKKLLNSLHPSDIWDAEFSEFDPIALNFLNGGQNQSNKVSKNVSSDTLSMSESITSKMNKARIDIKEYFVAFKNNGFLNLCLAMVVASLGYQVANVHIVNYADDLALTGNAQILLTCLGGSSAIGPLINPLFVDKFENQISKFRIFQIFVLCYGITVMFLPLVNSYNSLIILCSLIGYCDGSFSTIIGPLIIDLIGIEKARDGIGLYYGSIALSVTIAAPLAGFIYGVSQGYALPFYIAGALFLAGGFMLSFKHKTAQFNKDFTGADNLDEVTDIKK